MQLCRKASVQRDLSNNNRFSTEDIIDNIPRTKKRKKSSDASNFIMETKYNNIQRQVSNSYII